MQDFNIFVEIANRWKVLLYGQTQVLSKDNLFCYSNYTLFLILVCSPCHYGLLS